MTAEEVALEKHRLDDATRRYEAGIGFLKVLAGTTLVGTAVAAFPFLQKKAELVYQADFDRRNLIVESRKAHRDFLVSLGSKGQSPDINERLALADFYFFLSVDPKTKTSWEQFRQYLLEEISKLDAAKQQVAEEQNKAKIDYEALAKAESLLESLREKSLVVPPKPVEASGFRELAANLLSDNKATRRAARTSLADLGVPLVRPALDVISQSGTPYRLTLGLVVALTEMMRANKKPRRLISGELSDDDLRVLVPLAANPDRTIRIYASEFLYDLGDPRSFSLAVEAFQGTNESNARYNLALVMKGAAPFLTPGNVVAAKQDLNSLRPEAGSKTRQLIGEAIAKLPGAD